MELEITNITEENKKEKLTTAALVLAYMLDIPLELNGVMMEKDALLEKVGKETLNQLVPTGLKKAVSNLFHRGGSIKKYGMDSGMCYSDPLQGKALHKSSETYFRKFEPSLPNIPIPTDNIIPDSVIQSSAWLLEKAKLHKYLKKEFKNGIWHYTYETDRKQAAGKLDLCTSQPLKVTSENAKKLGERFIKNWKKDWQHNPEKRKCPALNYTKIGFDDISLKHLSIKGGNKTRAKDIIMERARILPFAKEILEGKNKGIGTMVRVDENKQLVYYEVVGRAMIDGREETISVIVSKYKPDAKKYISVIKKAVSQWLHGNSLIDSHTSNGGVDINSLQRHRSHRNNEAISSYFQPLLPNKARVNNSHPTDTILVQSTQKNKSYPDIILDIQNISEANKYEKFTKALKAAAKQLNTPIGVFDLEKTGEKHLYPIKQELSDYWASFYTNILDELYISLTEILELPAVSIETMQKSFMSKVAQTINNLFGNFKLKYKGSIIYNPETGEPILKKDFDKLVRAIEAVLNLNTKDAAKRITLDSVTVSKLLKRLASFQTSEQLKSHTLDNLKYKNKSFEWIREEYKNLTTVLGDPLSLKEKARYQVCEDKAAQLITRVNDDIRNGIKEVLLDGISERKSKAQVSQDLFNKFGSLNRNWKRIVETEMVNTSNLAAILEEVYNAPEDEKVYFIRHEMADACEHCKNIDGVIALWSAIPLESDKIQDEYASIALWEGKVADSRTGIVGTGALHPHCRGFWERWGTEEFNAQTAMLNGKEKEWNEAVKKAQEEYKTRGIENPHDCTKGYKDRIREIYKELSK